MFLTNTRFITFLSIFFTFLFINPLVAQQKIKGELTSNDQVRKYRLYLPSTYHSDKPMPLVFNLHGLTSDPGQQQLLTQMNEVAEENGFIVCYPKGKNRAWNVNFPFPSSKADDVQFIADLIDQLNNLYNLDLNRVYACGFSNGGYMSHRLACELSDRIVAIASVAGSIVSGEEENCHPSRAVPVLQIHGKADPIVPYRGNFNGMAIEDLVDFWVEKNGCDTESTLTKIPNTAKLDFSKAVRYDFDECQEGAAVAFYKIKNGGHTWPGTKLLLGVTNRDFEASTEIWNFFKQFSFDNKITSRNTSPNKTNFTISPNPTNGLLKIQGETNTAKTLTRSLYNLQGQEILSLEKAHFVKGIINWSYNLSHLPKGFYILKLADGAQVISKKIILE